jgi:outer membrane protein OmpA-like peptidoglycan-associated protein/Mg-chelatase subunit ChlD
MKKNIYYICLIILLIVFVPFVNAQTVKRKKTNTIKTKGFCSKDSRYFAVNYAIQKTNQKGDAYFQNMMKVYHVKSRRYISRLDYDTGKEPQMMYFSPSNEKIIVKDSRDYFVFDVKNRKLDKEFERISCIGFTVGDGEVLYYEQNKVFLYDIEANKVKFVFNGINEKEQIIHLWESPLQDWIIAQTDKSQIYFWKRNITIPQKIIQGFDIKYSKEISQFHVLDYSNRLCQLNTYQSDNLELISSFNSDLYLPYSTYNFSNGSSISPDGQKVAFCAKRFGSTIGFSIYDIQTQKQIEIVDTLKIKDQFNESEQPYIWIDENTILLQLKDKIRTEKSYFNNVPIFKKVIDKKDALYTISKDTIQFLDLRHHFTEELISENGKWMASWIPQSGKKSSIVALENSFIPQENPLYIDNINALCFSPNNEFLFVEKIKGEERLHSFLYTQDIEKNISPTLFDFATKPYKPSNEATILEDATPPTHYHYTFIKNYKSFQQITDSTELEVVFKTKLYKNDSIGLAFYIMDKEGNYYENGNIDNFNKLICKFQLIDSLNNEINLPEWNIHEQKDEVKKPLSMAIVSDHSGSMGEDRAIVMQEGIEKMIREKHPKDSIALIRYDSKVVLNSLMATNTNTLLNKNPKNGLRGFGGATALIDAAHEGVMQMARDYSGKKRILILFTDGLENSSFITKNELIQDARIHHVCIYVIAFGEMVDEEFLKEIAYSTGGGYYHIYQTNYFMDIFRDVYQKIHHYYTIKFRLSKEGAYKAKITFCKENIEPIEVDFHTKPIFIDEKPVIVLKESGITDLNTVPEEGDIKHLEIHFEFASHKIVENSKPIIEEVANYLIKYPTVEIELHGHTDNIGGDEFNQQLSEKRALEVKNNLVKHGIVGNRINIKGFGEGAPIASNEHEKGRRLNRRTEMVIIKK